MLRCATLRDDLRVYSVIARRVLQSCGKVQVLISVCLKSVSATMKERHASSLMHLKKTGSEDGFDERVYYKL